jgi:hypothetical protein
LRLVPPQLALTFAHPISVNQLAVHKEFVHSLRKASKETQSQAMILPKQVMHREGSSDDATVFGLRWSAL